MKVLYLIKAGIMGGRERHVLTLARSLPKEVEACVCAVSAGETTEAMAAAGLDVRVLGGRNGHDPRILPRFIRLLREFKPDVVHAHTGALIPYIVMRFFPKIALVQSVHGPSVSGAELAVLRKSFAWKIKSILVRILERKPDYCLPVSQATWDEFKIVNPDAKGEVFFNALNLDDLAVARRLRGSRPTEWVSRPNPSARKRVVGMVGRMADVKDWPLFSQIAQVVMNMHPDVEFWAVGADAGWAKSNGCITRNVKWLGSRQDARDLIAQMDVCLLTSKYEQLPTTLLEAFAIGVPVVGVLPDGGTKEVLALSDKMSALLHDNRDCERIAQDVVRVLGNASLRDEMIREGRKIVTEHFDMKKLCATQLTEIYNRIIKEKR